MARRFCGSGMIAVTVWGLFVLASGPAQAVGDCVEGMRSVYNRQCDEVDIEDGQCTTRYEQTPPTYWCCCPDDYEPTTTKDPTCPFAAAAQATADPGDALLILRAVRDRLYGHSDLGRAYVALSYRHARAITQILLFHPSLLADATDLLDLHMAFFDLLAKGQAATISSTDMNDIRDFLQAVADEAGQNQELRDAIQRVRGDLLNPQLLGTFNVTVTN